MRDRPKWPQNTRKKERLQTLTVMPSMKMLMAFLPAFITNFDTSRRSKTVGLPGRRNTARPEVKPAHGRIARVTRGCGGVTKQPRYHYHTTSGVTNQTDGGRSGAKGTGGGGMCDARTRAHEVGAEEFRVAEAKHHVAVFQILSLHGVGVCVRQPDTHILAADVVCGRDGRAGELVGWNHCVLCVWYAHLGVCMCECICVCRRACVCCGGAAGCDSTQAGETHRQAKEAVQQLGALATLGIVELYLAMHAQHSS
jgi:hypothetical protein